MEFQREQSSTSSYWLVMEDLSPGQIAEAPNKLWIRNAKSIDRN
jgi:hypothetical protein